jgi:hypothetical protein
MKIIAPDFASDNLGLAIKLANQLLDGKRGFFREVSQVKAFDMSFNPETRKPYNGKEILYLLSQKVDIVVQKYKSWLLWSKATAYTMPGVPVIHLNERRLNRSVASLVGTLLHECVHTVDPNLRFSHGGNFEDGKSNTAPYKIGNIAEKIIASQT